MLTFKNDHFICNMFILRPSIFAHLEMCNYMQLIKRNAEGFTFLRYIFQRFRIDLFSIFHGSICYWVRLLHLFLSICIQLNVVNVLVTKLRREKLILNLFRSAEKCIHFCYKTLKNEPPDTNVPGNGNQFKIAIHTTKHLIGFRQRLLQTIARKVA